MHVCAAAGLEWIMFEWSVFSFQHLSMEKMLWEIALNEINN